MTSTYLITLAVFGVAFAGMAIGVILSNRRIKGSCGGLANLRDEHGSPMCGACTNPAPSCTGREDARRREAAAANEAT